MKLIVNKEDDKYEDNYNINPQTTYIDNRLNKLYFSAFVFIIILMLIKFL